MKKTIFIILISFLTVASSGNSALAVSCSGKCSSTCTSPSVLLSGDCPSGQVCCSGAITNPGSVQPPALPGATGDSQGSSNMRNLNFKENIQTVSTIQEFLASSQGYLNAVAGTIAIIFILIGASLYIISAFGKEDLAALGKKIVIVAVGGFTIIVAAPVFLKEILSLTGGDVSQMTTTPGIKDIITKTATGFLSFVGMYAIIGFLFGGFTYFFAAGDEKRAERGKTIVTYSIIGVVIVIGAMIIAKQIVQLLGG